jgi:N4-gp56 family major capsid protein
MAINYAAKYESQIQKAFTLKSLTESAVNKNYSWEGVNTINVYSLTTQALNDYDATATSNRYGTPSELQNSVQTMLIANDKSFSTSIDRKTLQDTNGATKAAEFLKLEIDEQITPTIDIYRLRKMYTAAIANNSYAYATTDKTTAYTQFLAGQEKLGEAKVPAEGRIAFCSFAFYSLIKQDTSFMLASEVAMEKRINGMVGMVDGVKLVVVPSSYLAPNVSFILTHPVATVAAEKLDEYFIRTNVQGFSGVVIEGRVRYDAFVLDTKVDAIYVHGTNILS